MVKNNPLITDGDQLPAASSIRKLDVAAYVAASIVPAVLEVLGQRWSLGIVQALLLDGKSFGQLLRELNIPRSTLAARLKHLQTMGCVLQSPSGYGLSESGQALLPIASLAMAWDAPAATHASCAGLIHRCSQQLSPVLVCAHCERPIRASDLKLGAPGERPHLIDFPKPLRRSRAGFSAQGPLRATDILGDRWTALIVALVFYGVQRYSDLEHHLAIAPNILADRLLRLCAGDVLLHQGTRYRFSERGQQLFPLIIALMNWGDRWLRQAGQTPAPMLHLPCGHMLQPALRCGACGDTADQPSLQAVSAAQANQGA